MAILSTGEITGAAGAFSVMSFKRQVLVLIMLASSIAAGVYVALWARTPNLVPLYAHLEPAESQQVLDVLEKSDFYYRFSAKTGILVKMQELHEARMKLASMGLPRNNNGMGYELLDKSQGFGTSQFMENVRYRRSIEGELSKTITALDAVQNARVHLGLPRQTSFLKRNNVSSASVMVDLYGGKELSSDQVMGIVYLVSSSVSGLNRTDITVVDQTGKMLSSNQSIAHMSAAVEESNYTNKKEKEYSRKIHELLEPILGRNSVRAEVSAIYDFTQSEETSETYENDKPKLRSEATTLEQQSNEFPQGVPGALSNQPPNVAQAPQEIGEATDKTTNKSHNSGQYRDVKTKNYELDRKVQHVQKSSGALQKLSVAVLLNDKITGYSPEGVPTRIALTDEELEKIEGLVKEAIGYNAERGDKVRVVNSSFAAEPPPPPPIPGIFDDPSQIFSKPWFLPLLKHIAGALTVIFLIYGVLKPMFKFLVETQPSEKEDEDEAPAGLNLPAPDLLTQQRIDHAKKLAHEDSKRSAQVIMNWVGAQDD